MIDKDTLHTLAVVQGLKLSEIAEQFGVTRERVGQVLRRFGFHAAWKARRVELQARKKVKHCRYCGEIVTEKWKQTHPECSGAALREYHRKRNNWRYHNDPTYRQYQYAWRKANPERVAAMLRRYADKLDSRQKRC